MILRPPRSTRTDTLFPYTTLFRSIGDVDNALLQVLLDLGLHIDEGVALPAEFVGQRLDGILDLVGIIGFARLRGDQRRERLVVDALDVAGDVHLAEGVGPPFRSEEHTSELQSLMRISYAVFCLKTKTQTTKR